MACKVQKLHMASVLLAGVKTDATRLFKGSKGASSNTVSRPVANEGTGGRQVQTCRADCLLNLSCSFALVTLTTKEDNPV